MFEIVNAFQDDEQRPAYDEYKPTHEKVDHGIAYCFYTGNGVLKVGVQDDGVDHKVCDHGDK